MSIQHDTAVIRSEESVKGALSRSLEFLKRQEGNESPIPFIIFCNSPGKLPAVSLGSALAGLLDYLVGQGLSVELRTHTGKTGWQWQPWSAVKTNLQTIKTDAWTRIYVSTKPSTI